MSDSSTRWRRVEAVFADAADREPADRPAFLDDACRRPDGAPDPALREEVEALLAADVAAPGFFDGAEARLGNVVDAALNGDAPERVGPWRLVEEVGRGGMGTVFRAERADGAFEQTAAVKLVRPGLADDLAARFRAERQILAGLDHPHVARLLGGGVADDGRPWLAMEFVQGEPITTYCDQRRLGVNERLALFEAVCEAVAYAHRNLVVHRDLKPSNVLVTDDGTVKLLDFGIAKLIDEADAGGPTTQTGRWLLTPEYAAPEQVTGGPVTTATDVYALGALLYELLTGRRAVEVDGRSPAAIERAILQSEPARPSDAVTASAPTGGRVPPDPAGDATSDTGALRSTTAERLRRRLRGDLDRIVMKALRKEPERRYEGAAALAADVRRHLAGLPVEARPDTAGYRVSTFVRRHRVGVAAAALVLLAVVGGAGVALWQAAEARSAQTRAEAEAHRANEAAARASRTVEFLEDIFAQGDPAATPGSTPVRELLARALDRVDEDLAGDPEAQASMLLALGRAYSAADLRDTAEVALERALDLRRQLRPRPDLDVVEVLGALGELNMGRDEYAAADSFYTMAVALAERAPGENGAVVAPLRLARAHAINRAGRHDEASSEAHRALVLFRDAHGDALAMADMLTAVAGIEQTARANAATPPTARNYRHSERHLREALALRRTELSPEHPLVGVTYGDLSNFYRVWSGEDDPAVAANPDSLLQLGLGFLNETERIFSAVYGPDHARPLAVLWNKAGFVKDTGDLDGAIEIARETFRRAEVVYGRDHGMRAMAAHNLQHYLAEVGRPQEALPIAREALDIYRRSGQTGVPYAVRWYEVGARLDESGDRPGACDAFREAYALYTALPPETREGMTYTRARGAIGLCLLDKGRASEALPLLRQSLNELRTEEPGRFDLDRLRVRFQQGIERAGPAGRAAATQDRRRNPR